VETGWISQAIGFVALLIGGWWVRRQSTPTEQSRAQHLAQIATDTAALVVSANPKAAWAQMLEQTVQQLTGAAGIPVTNRDALQRAAAGALARLGKLPGAA